MSGHNLTYKVEVEPWLFKYLEYKLGPSPWKLTTNHYEGQLLLSNMATKSRAVKNIPWKKGENTILYEIIIPWYYTNQKGKYFFCEDNLNRFIRLYKNRFKEELIIWFEARECITNGTIKTEGGVRKFFMKDTLLAFAQKIGLTEEEMPYETMKKLVYRHFTKQKSRVEIVG